MQIACAVKPQRSEGDSFLASGVSYAILTKGAISQKGRIGISEFSMILAAISMPDSALNQGAKMIHNIPIMKCNGTIEDTCEYAINGD